MSSRIMKRNANLQRSVLRRPSPPRSTGSRSEAAARRVARPSNETLSQTFRESHGRDVAYQLSLPGFKIFDNLYHVGVGTVSTWLIPTTPG